MSVIPFPRTHLHYILTAGLPIPIEAITDIFQWADLTAESASTAPQSEPRTQSKCVRFRNHHDYISTHPARRIISMDRESQRDGLEECRTILKCRVVQTADGGSCQISGAKPYLRLSLTARRAALRSHGRSFVITLFTSQYLCCTRKTLNLLSISCQSIKTAIMPGPIKRRSKRGELASAAS
jgi:hypothetical protein